MYNEQKKERETGTAEYITVLVRRDPRKFYHSAAYKRWRATVLRNAGYLCQECRRYGRTDKDGLPVAAVVAHHIIEVKDAPELALDPDNGQALCLACHNRLHPEKMEQAGQLSRLRARERKGR